MLCKGGFSAAVVPQNDRKASLFYFKVKSVKNEYLIYLRLRLVIVRRLGIIKR